MKIFLTLLLFGTTACGCGSFTSEWEKWKVAHGKSYGFEEELKRQDIWEQNLMTVVHHNMEADSGIQTYRLEMNKFADVFPQRDDEERQFLQLNPGPKTTQSPCNSSRGFPRDKKIPDAMDWRTQGAVTPVQNQGTIGKSWAFSATGSLESQRVIKTGRVVKLSEQNLADCATAAFSPHCVAANVDCAFYYVMKNEGIDTEMGYPKPTYPDGLCHYTAAARGATCSGCVDLPSGDERSLQFAVANIGPISATIDAGHISFQLYQSGVYYEPNCSATILDHAVLIVGYGTENGRDYWIVKNSWGTSWGEKGYIKMARNQGNNCGIASTASYPVM